jgi:cell division septum initiation protein DivIVA
MTALDPKNPEFTVGLRGYDRTEVDRYIEYLQGLVEEADQRAREAHAEFVFDEHAAIGPRIAEIFALAEAEARELRERVVSEATQLVSEARTEATAIVDAAEHSARETRERARHDHAELLDELEGERDRIREEVAELELRRAEAIGELNRLRDVLGEAAGLIGGGQTDTTRALPPGDEETVELPPLTADTGEY